MRRRISLPALAAAAFLALPLPAAADPVTITGGHVETLILSSLARGVLEGDGFSLGFGADAFAVAVARDCTPCFPGSTIDLGARFSDSRASGRAMVDGVEYPQIFFGLTGTFTSPSFQIGGNETVTLTRPFSFSGSVTGYAIDPFIEPSEPVFTRTLVGQGTATATFTFLLLEEVGPTFTATDLRYDFGTAAPVPEPGTMLLCGTAFAALAARRRRRLHRTRM